MLTLTCWQKWQYLLWLAFVEVDGESLRKSEQRVEGEREESVQGKAAQKANPGRNNAAEKTTQGLHTFPHQRMMVESRLLDNSGSAEGVENSRCLLLLFGICPCFDGSDALSSRSGACACP